MRVTPGDEGEGKARRAQSQHDDTAKPPRSGPEGVAQLLGASAAEKTRLSDGRRLAPVVEYLLSSRSACIEASDAELHAFASESWFTAEGARKKLRRLQRAGLPDFQNWRFVTLTMANHSGHPWSAYVRGKERLRRFLARFRRAIGRAFRWCWKLEFHDDGFAHWHLLIEYTKRVPAEFLPDLETWWGLGRVNVRRVKRRDIFYVFKYVAKSVEDAPEWIARHKGRIRVFQASAGFYSKRRTRVAEPREPATCLVPVNLATKLGWDARKALLVTVNGNGQRRARAVKLRTTFSALLVMRAYETIRLGRQLAAPGVVNLSQLQALEIMYEHRKYAGLAGIPANAAAA